VSWTASTDNVSVTGYNVWRSTSQTGTYTKVATVTTLTFSDAPLTSGATYFYYVTAVDAAGNVSAPSSIASVIVR
jgi:fibronectin type 3 domain-containing protein